MTRRQLRDSIFKALFRIEFNGEQERQEQLEFHLQELAEPEQEVMVNADASDLEYVRRKVSDIYTHLEEIDEAISTQTEGWALKRIGKAELAILRLAVYEMNYDDEVPQGVAINEAVELTKTYCDEDAKGFVNAVLGKLAKS